MAMAQRADFNDTGLLQQSITTAVSGVDLLTSACQNGTAEVQALVREECDVILECRYCRNLFRSLVNFISHKRSFCRSRHAVYEANARAAAGEDSAASSDAGSEKTDEASAEQPNDDGSTPTSPTETDAKQRTSILGPARAKPSGSRRKGAARRTNPVRALGSRLSEETVFSDGLGGRVELLTLPAVTKRVPRTNIADGVQTLVDRGVVRSLAQKEPPPSAAGTVVVMPAEVSERYATMTLRRRAAVKADRDPVLKNVTDDEIGIIERMQAADCSVDVAQLTCIEEGCNQRFTSVLCLAHHVSRVHPPAAAPRTCFICGVTLRAGRKAAAHFRSHGLADDDADAEPPPADVRKSSRLLKLPADADADGKALAESEGEQTAPATEPRARSARSLRRRRSSPAYADHAYSTTKRAAPFGLPVERSAANRLLLSAKRRRDRKRHLSETVHVTSDDAGERKRPRSESAGEYEAASVPLQEAVCGALNRASPFEPSDHIRDADVEVGAEEAVFSTMVGEPADNSDSLVLTVDSLKQEPELVEDAPTSLQRASENSSPVTPILDRSNADDAVAAIDVSFTPPTEADAKAPAASPKRSTSSPLTSRNSLAHSLPKCEPKGRRRARKSVPSQSPPQLKSALCLSSPRAVLESPPNLPVELESDSVVSTVGREEEVPAAAAATAAQRPRRDKKAPARYKMSPPGDDEEEKVVSAAVAAEVAPPPAAVVEPTKRRRRRQTAARRPSSAASDGGASGGDGGGAVSARVRELLDTPVASDYAKLPIIVPDELQTALNSAVRAGKTGFSCAHCCTRFAFFEQANRHSTQHLAMARFRCRLCLAAALFSIDIWLHFYTASCPRLTRAEKEAVRDMLKTQGPVSVDRFTLVIDAESPGRVARCSGLVISKDFPKGHTVT